MPERIGRYVVFGPIASGGMATVHLSRLHGPLGFRRTLAAKKLRREIESPELSLTLVDEARLGARVQHPNVVQIVDVVSEGEELVVFMEHVLGASLARLMGRARAAGSPVDVAIACAITAGALRGLHAAHEATDETGAPLHIVHRDVSPQNVLVGVDGVARVADFGIAMALGRLQTTREGQVKGKLAYMSPEQMRGEAVDRRTDLFAAAIVLWELLAGRRLFGGEDEKTTIGRVLVADVPPPSQLRSQIGPALDAVVLRALSRDVDARFPTALAFVDALAAASPLATTSDVGRWVEALCGDEVSERRRAIAAIERDADVTPHDPAPEDATASAVDAPARPSSVEPASAAPATPTAADTLGATPRTRWIAVLVVLGTAALTVALFFLRRTPDVGAARAAPVETAAPSAPSPVHPAVLVEASAPSASASAAAIPSVASAIAPVTTARAPVSPARGPDCTNPYVLDAQGRKRYRRECLRK